MVAKQGQWAQQRMEGDNDRGRNWPYVDGRDSPKGMTRYSKWP